MVIPPVNEYHNVRAQYHICRYGDHCTYVICIGGDGSIIYVGTLLYSMPGGGRTYAGIGMYIPRAPISIYTGGGGDPGLDVKTARKRSLPIEHVYTYIP